MPASPSLVDAPARTERPIRSRLLVLVTVVALVLTGVAVGLATSAPAGAVTTAQADRVIAAARSQVGRARYVEGGSSPRTGFDCSGYVRWVFTHARVGTLPHSAEAQRHVKGMHRVSRSAARRGDLVFYLSGGSAYHVAIYAGHGMQYAAATKRDGIRYQRVWSNAVQYVRYH